MPNTIKCLLNIKIDSSNIQSWTTVEGREVGQSIAVGLL